MCEEGPPGEDWRMGWQLAPQEWVRFAATACAYTLTRALYLASQMLVLLKTSGPYIHSEGDWRTVCAILRLASQRPEAAPAAFEALAAACQDRSALSAEARSGPEATSFAIMGS